MAPARVPQLLGVGLSGVLDTGGAVVVLVGRPVVLVDVVDTVDELVVVERGVARRVVEVVDGFDADDPESSHAAKPMVANPTTSTRAHAAVRRVVVIGPAWRSSRRRRGH